MLRPTENATPADRYNLWHVQYWFIYRWRVILQSKTKTENTTLILTVLTLILDLKEQVLYGTFPGGGTDSMTSLLLVW